MTAASLDDRDPERSHSLRPTTIPRFDVDDYARRCDASLRGSLVGAVPPLFDLARRRRQATASQTRERSLRKISGLAALLRTFTETR